MPHRVATAGGCLAVPDYEFYRLQEPTSAVTLDETAPAGSSPAIIADVCRATARCNAFTTVGRLMLVPMVATLGVMDGSAADTASCDGTYVTKRALSGLTLPVSSGMTLEGVW